MYATNAKSVCYDDEINMISFKLNNISFIDSDDITLVFNKLTLLDGPHNIDNIIPNQISSNAVVIHHNELSRNATMRHHNQISTNESVKYQDEISSNDSVKYTNQISTNESVKYPNQISTNANFGSDDLIKKSISSYFIKLNGKVTKKRDNLSYKVAFYFPLYYKPQFKPHNKQRQLHHKQRLSHNKQLKLHNKQLKLI
jgi:hypothetical protein